jgi:hypothetical protein
VKRFFLGGFFCAMSLWAQKMVTVTATPGLMIPVHTAVRHLTVIELESPIEKVAAESDNFEIEWRDNTVFIYPQRAGAATNLFVWTKRGRVVYEVLPPGSDIGQMDVSLDTRLPAPPAPATAPKVSEQIPADMIVRARTVDWAGSHKIPKHKACLLVRDAYREKDRLYLRYELQNNSAESLSLGPPRVTAAPVATLPSPLRVGRVLEIAPDRAAALAGQPGDDLPVLVEESLPGSVAAGKTSVGIVGVRLPIASSGPALLVRLWLPVRNGSPLLAVVVVP